MSALEIHALLVASTAHITLDEARQLDACGYARDDCGWFFYVGERGCHVLCEIDRFSQGLKGIVRRARQAGCRYVLLDRDAKLLEDVATYEW
jgi:hypothetical protein